MGPIFADHLALVLKALAVSRGQLAAALEIDKSLVSRWLSGATVPGNHNLARLTGYIAQRVAGFTMLDWEHDAARLAARLGLDQGSTAGRTSDFGTTPPGVVADSAAPLLNLPNFARLPAFASSAHETAARGSRYCGLWRSWMPTVGRALDFHCEHTAIWQEDGWLAGYALGFSYRWPMTGYIANGQLTLLFSDNFDFVTRIFSRADQPIIDQVDGLMLAAASLPHQAPTACRVLMQRITPADATRAEIDDALEQHASERRLIPGDEMSDEMCADLLPDCGPASVAGGGDRLMRTDISQRLVRTRWF